LDAVPDEEFGGHAISGYRFPAECAVIDPPGTAGRTSCFQYRDRKSTRLNSSHVKISYAVFGLKKKKQSAWTRRQVALRIDRGGRDSFSVGGRDGASQRRAPADRGNRQRSGRRGAD